MLALVIDDSAVTRKVLSQILRELGFEVLEATNGLEGLVRLQEIKRAAHLVMVDWNMPEMDGIDFVRAVRAQATYDGLPLVMVTTHNDGQHIAMALEAGANEYIMKPFTQDVVRGKLELLGLFSQRAYVETSSPHR